jgi:3-oxoacyl-(acyl-carrier-protein) synthase
MTGKMAIRTFPTAYKLKAIKRAERRDGVVSGQGAGVEIVERQIAGATE